MKKNHFLIFLFLFLSHDLIACECAVQLNSAIEKKVTDADYVALIKVQKIMPNKSKDDYIINVEEIKLYKGNSVKDIIVYGGNWNLHNNYATSCDLGINENEEWIIFGKKINNEIRIGFCSHSIKYKDADGYRNWMNQYPFKTIEELNTYFKYPSDSTAIVNGKRILYFPNGNIEVEENYRSGMKNGPAKYYYTNGKLNGEEYYRKNKLHKTQTWYYPNGDINSIKHFKNGIQRDTSVFNVYGYKDHKLYLWSLSLYNKKGILIHNKSYQLPTFLFSKDDNLYYLNSERLFDPKTRIETYYSYHSNGVVSEFYQIKDHEYIGDEISYNDEGKIIKRLKVNSNGKNEVLYLDPKYYSSLKQ